MLRILLLMIATSLMAAPAHVKEFLSGKGMETYRFFKKTEYRDVALIIVSMEALESGWGLSKYHVNHNNPYSISKYDKVNKRMVLRTYRSDNHCREVLLRLFRKKKYGTRDIDTFLASVDTQGYAEDKAYIEKIRGIYHRIKAYYD